MFDVGFYVVSVPTPASSPHMARQSPGIGLGVGRCALQLPAHLCLFPDTSCPPNNHTSLSSLEGNVEEPMFGLHSQILQKGLEGDLSSSPLHGCLEAVLESATIKHFIFTYCLIKDARMKGVPCLSPRSSSPWLDL